MNKTTIVLMIITICSKVFGFFREVILSFFFGASDISDAYLISQTIPSAIFSFFATGLSIGYIPLYTVIEEEHGEKEANRFTSKLTTLLLVICTVIIILGCIFAKILVKIFAAGFNGDTLALAATFTRISLLGIYFAGLVNIFGNFLRIKGNYTIPALVGFPLNFFTILFIVLSFKTNIILLAVGSIVAAASQFGLLLPFIFKEGYKYIANIDFKDKYVMKMVTMAIPSILGVSVNEINIIIDRTFASNIAVGGISALNYAAKLKGFVQGLFVLTISTVIYPVISKKVAQNNVEGIKKTITEAIINVNLLVIPASIGSIMFAKPIIMLLFGRGAFDVQAVAMTSNALLF